MQFTSTQVSSIQSSPTKKGVRRATTAFLAPERTDPTQKPNIASDIYAFSMFLVELTLPKRIHPFDDDLPPNSVLVEAAARGIRPTLPVSIDELSKEQYELWTSAILKAWSQDPNKRPNGQVLLNSLKEICRLIVPSFSENVTDEKSSFTVPNFEHPPELINLELHQGTAMEVLSEIAADSIKKTGDVTPHLRLAIDQTLETSDGTNSCVFLSLLILDNLKNQVNSDEIDITKVKSIAENTIKTAPEYINKFRDRGKFMAVDEVLTLLQGHDMLTFQYTLEERLLGRTSNYGYSESLTALETALCQLADSAPCFAIYTQTPVSFSILATENQLIIVDTHQLPESLGGNGNGAVVVFSPSTNLLETSSRYRRASSWILNRISKSVKLGPQSLVVLKATSSLKISSVLKDEDTVAMESSDDLDSFAWDDDDEILLESVSSLLYNSVTDDTPKNESFLLKFEEIPSAARDITIQGHATKLGIVKLKEFQLRAVKAVLEGRDSLIVQSTSSGKSVCFQLPAIILKEGLFVLVISPTVSLMESQVHSLTKLGVNAVFLGSSSSTDWNFSKLDNISTEEEAIPKLVYVTPEYLIGNEKRPGAYLKLPSHRIGLIVVDECHKIFERSGDFR